jgi:hypothetical protein
MIKNLIFLAQIIHSISEKNDEREGLTDFVRENNVSVNSRQCLTVFTKTLAIH